LIRIEPHRHVRLMILLNAIPRVILAPLLVIWLGVDLASEVAVGLALTGAVFGEFVASGRGPGYGLQLAQNRYDAGLTIGPIVFLVGFDLALFALVERRLLRLGCLP